MNRGTSALLVAALLPGACSEDGGIGFSITDHSDLVDSRGDDYASIDVFVSRNCFYAITIGGVLRYSGRWAEGAEEVRIPRQMLSPCENAVRVEVAAQDGSARSDEVEVSYCRNDCDEECEGQGGLDSGVSPGPDSGVDAGPDDPRFEHLCEECVGYPDDCGGPPNLCINYPGGAICGIDCAAERDCPAMFACYEVSDDYGNTMGWVCMPDPLWSDCIY
ncbi:MAG: hypothetical protein HYY06_15500 [Deltaproteobacteria bacterium]|nr:hypothetical protein [Deltaproteobacteria bacterium]